MSEENIFTTGEPAYFNDTATFFAGIQAELTGNVIGDVQGNIFAPDTCIFENGPIIIGALEPTDTPGQALQVSGGGYFESEVGIGTTNPLSSFVVYGTSEITGMTTFTYGPVIIGSASSTNTSQQRLQVTGGAYISGNTGIGTTNPKSKLDVVGDISVTGIITAATFDASKGFLIIGSGTSTGTVSQNLQVTGGTYISGNTGIGTTNPTQELHVQGDARITGGIYDSNNSVGSDNQLLMSNGTAIVWQPFVSATGGTTSDITVGTYTYRVHQFTSSGTFAVTTGGPVEYFVLGGGGGGGGRYYAGGGGAGGLVSGEFTVLPSTSYTVEVGAGGAGGGVSNIGTGDFQSGMQGNPSRFGNIIAPGGGGGGSRDRQVYAMGKPGGCGGGASGYDGEGSGFNLCGSGSHGYRGGRGGGYGGGGGGGLGAVGADGSGDTAGEGGSGLVSNITGTNVTYGGGGGGARGDSTGAGGAGGDGGGGAGGSYPGGSGQNGTANTGGGGGGASDVTGSTAAGDGGSGIVIIRYRTA